MCSDNKEPRNLVRNYLLAQRCNWSNNLQEAELKVKCIHTPQSKEKLKYFVWKTTFLTSISIPIVQIREAEKNNPLAETMSKPKIWAIQKVP